MSARLYFIGQPRFEREGQKIELTSAKAVALLAYLTATNTSQSRDRILALLWAESADEAARKNLRNTLWTIRKTLGDDILSVDNHRLMLEPGVWTDIHAFQQGVNLLVDWAGSGNSSGSNGNSHLAPVGSFDTINDKQQQTALLDMYSGSFLDGLTLSEAPDFELWLAAERERFAQLYATLLTQLIKLRQGERDWAEVIALARRALGQDSLQESMYRAIMDAYARLGERSEALRQYDLLRSTLTTELGVEPLPETQALYTAIMSGSLQPVPASPIQERDPRTEHRPPILGDTPRAAFIGRQTEFDSLQTEFELAAQGQMRVVLMTGEIGIGKSRLWQEWAATLPLDQRLLEGHCLESTQTLPFSALTEIFNHRVCATQLFVKDSTIPLVWLAEIARLFPEIRRALPDLPAPAALPPAEERLHIFEAFTQCFWALAQQQPAPLILFIDDLHWADRTLLEWLDYMIHRLHDQPFLLVGSYRPSDAPTPLIQVAAGWGREGLLHRLPLERLTPQESLALVESLGGDLGIAEHIQTQSAGNPYFVIELMRAAPGDLPPTLADLLNVRISNLPDTVRQVLQAATILEPEIDFDTLEKVSGRNEDETLDALDTLLNVDILVERSGRYTFVHPLVAAVVRGSLSSARRKVLHRRAALARESEYANRLPPIAGRLVAHYAEADDPVKAAFYADMAAKYAMSLAATNEARVFYEQAMSLDPNPTRQLGLAMVHVWQGNITSARELYLDVLRQYEAQHDDPNAARVCLMMAESYISSGFANEVEDWVGKALAKMDIQKDHDAHARAHFLLGARKLINDPSLLETERHLLEAIHIATQHNLLEVAVRSRFELGNLLAERGDLIQAITTYKETIKLAQETGEPMQEALATNNVAYHAMLIGDLPEACTYIERGLAFVETRGLRLPLQYLYSTRGEIALAENQYDEAEHWFQKGISEAERMSNLRHLVNLQANLGLVAFRRGDLDTALVTLNQAREAAQSLAAPHMQSQIDLWLTELYLQRGEIAAAAETLHSAETRLKESGRKRLIEEATHLRSIIDDR